MKPLGIPTGVEQDPKARELVRLWAANEKLNVSIAIGAFAQSQKREEECWAIVMSDFTRHVGRALAQRYGANEEQVVAAIREKYLEELQDPTSEVEGE